ncbi:MAG: aldo/keto reductase [Chloroflexi bacterium]|jgi:aryl-alcohol dehydrogenase-like predicted oxidoreductase|nr:aldo/keto reductase [Chloroflexota bacterium]MBT6707625.1 aldo/keto reductase [Chloroflexota bacterium]MBT7003125.1 aldo/keto reductase [Chloroflexota bacterium]MBT7078459.1 aldo/keto reductase [Chloroflexota bacterium]
MTYSKVDGVELPVSRIVMGTLFAKNVEQAGPVFDEFVSQGGNCFDTARHYGDAELVFGEWMWERGVREDTVVITKGAHTPECNPAAVTRQLDESLERLQTDFIDIYFLHRDNTRVPVGEFVDVLNEHKDAGRIGVFGGSNWSLERTDEANEYADKNGLSGFSVLSNHMSLARMVEAPWDGCLAASDAESRAWLAEQQMPLFPWSAQARGFFVHGRAGVDLLDDPELVRCWYSDDNFERLARVRSIAEKQGVDAVSVALAYVLNQQSPTFPLMGPVSVEEARSSLAALDVELSSDDVEWLNLEV